jgi:hypothetical protein
MMTWTPNLRPFEAFVNFGNGKKTHLHFEPNELHYDQNGVVRLISVEYKDGGIGNFKLLPRNKTADQVLKLVGDWIMTFGLSWASGRIIQGKTTIPNLSRWMAKKIGGMVVQDLCAQVRTNFCSYYAMDNGELVIADPIYYAVGEKMAVLWKAANRVKGENLVCTPVEAYYHGTKLLEEDSDIEEMRVHYGTADNVGRRAYTYEKGFWVDEERAREERNRRAGL